MSKQLLSDTPLKRPRKRLSHVWVVLYSWDYEGSQLQAVYAYERDAKKYPRGGDHTDVLRVPIRYKPSKERE